MVVKKRGEVKGGKEKRKWCKKIEEEKEVEVLVQNDEALP